RIFHLIAFGRLWPVDATSGDAGTGHPDPGDVDVRAVVAVVVGEVGELRDVRSRRREEIVPLREEGVRRRAQRVRRLYVEHVLLERPRLVLGDLLGTVLAVRDA